MAKSYSEWSARANELGINSSYAAYQGYLNNIGETDPALSAPKVQTNTSTSVSTAFKERAAADADPSSASFSTIHGSQGVTNDVFAKYAQSYPDLMENYYRHWAKGAPQPLSQNNEGISLAEFGAMHYSGKGRTEGRVLPGTSSGGGGAVSSGGGGGGGGGGSSIQARDIDPVYPMIMQAYSAPNAQDWSAYMPDDTFLGGDGGLLYQPWSQQYLDRYVPQGLVDYVPPEINGMMPVYYQNPIGLLNVAEFASELEEARAEAAAAAAKPAPTRDPFGDPRGGGREGDADDPGYNNPQYGYQSIGDMVNDLLGLGYVEGGVGGYAPSSHGYSSAEPSGYGTGDV